MNHEFLNSVIENYNEIFNGNYSEYLIKKELMPGNLYHHPVPIRDKTAPNPLMKWDIYEPIDVEKVIAPFAWSVKDAQIKAQIYVGRMLFGYAATRRLSTESNQEAYNILHPFMENMKLDVIEKIQEIHPETFNKRPYVGNTFLGFVKNKQGNYFHELDDACAYQLTYFTNCGISPPEFIYLDSFNTEISKKLWNIGFKK